MKSSGSKCPHRNPRRHAHHLAPTDRHGRRSCPAGGRVPPHCEGRYPVILTYGIYGKGLAYQEGYPLQWQKMVDDYPEILEGSTNKYQNWEVHRPRALGPARLRRHPGGLPRCRLVAGLHAAQFSAGTRRPLSVHRVGRNPAMVHRQGRHARDLLLRPQSVAGGGHASAPSGRHHPLGGRERPLSRCQLPRRHSLPVSGAVVQGPGGRMSSTAAGTRRARTPTPASRSPVPSPFPKRNWPKTGSTPSKN